MTNETTCGRCGGAVSFRDATVRPTERGLVHETLADCVDALRTALAASRAEAERLRGALRDIAAACAGAGLVRDDADDSEREYPCAACGCQVSLHDYADADQTILCDPCAQERLARVGDLARAALAPATEGT